MTVAQYLKIAVKKLAAAEIGTARLDVLILLEDVTGIDRARLLAEPDTKLSSAQIAKLEKLLTQRARHKPLAYVRKKTEFYGRMFKITPAVLEPRPESETMIEMFKNLAAAEFPTSSGINKDQPLRIADVGTGSGALGITAALEVPNAVVELLDIDPKALAVAKNNVDLFTLTVSVVESDLLSQTPKPYHLLLCNLPYVPDDYMINHAAAHEPKVAIFGGADGLEVYRRLFQQIRQRTTQPLYILTESLPPQHAELQSIARHGGYQLQQTEDFIQLFRLIQSLGA